MTAGQILHTARFAKRYSLRDVADMTGVSISTLSRIERDGEGEFCNVAAFALVVGVDLNEVGKAAVAAKEQAQ